MPICGKYTKTHLMAKTASLIVVTLMAWNWCIFQVKTVDLLAARKHHGISALHPSQAWKQHPRAWHSISLNVFFPHCCLSSCSIPHSSFCLFWKFNLTELNSEVIKYRENLKAHGQWNYSIFLPRFERTF